MSGFTIDGKLFNLEARDHEQGLFVLMDRLDKTAPKGLLMINEAPVMITEYINGDVHPLMGFPDIQYNEELGVVVQVIHVRALAQMIHEFRNTEFTIKIAEIQSKKLTGKNTIQVDMKTFKSVLRNLRKK